MNEVLCNIKARRSTRAYAGRQVAEGDLDLVLEAATHAPSGMNLQAWHFTVVQNAEKLAELNERIKAAFAKSNDPQKQGRGQNPSYCCYYHAPTLVIVSADETNRLSPFDCACALENIFLAATSLGIASCWINQPGETCEDPGVRACLTGLGVPENYRVYGCAALGYPSEDSLPKPKKLAEGTINFVR